MKEAPSLVSPLGRQDVLGRPDGAGERFIRPITPLLAILVFGSFQGATAQERTPAIESGQQVRVTTQLPGGEPLVGMLVRVARDSVVLRPPGEAEPVTLAIAAVSRFERARRRPGLSGALLGTGIGAAGGALLAMGAEAFAGADESRAPVYGAVAGGVLGALPGAGGWAVAKWTAIGFGGGVLVGGIIGAVAKPAGDISSEDAALVGAGLLGLIGYSFGTLVGYSNSRWQDVPLERLRVSIAPTGAAALGITFTLRRRASCPHPCT